MATGAATSTRLELAPVLVGAVVAADDHVPMSTEAADVDLDAAPGGEAAACDAELAMDVDRLARMLLQERKQRLAEPRVMAGVVGAPGALAGAAEEVGGVVMGDGIAAAAARASVFWRLVHGARVGRRRRGG